MPDNKRTIGQIEIVGLSDGGGDREANRLFPDVPESAWDRFKAPNASGPATITMNYGCFLLRTPDITLLVDTGVGGALLSGLEAAGVRPEDVQAVAYTHLHGDHVGGNLTGPEDNPTATFPNARYFVPRGEWTHFVEESSPGYNARVHDKFKPLHAQGLVQLVDDGESISPGLTILATPGHTAGHCSILVQSGDAKAVIVGDAIIHPIQVGKPEWNSTFESDPATATQSRLKLVERMAQDGSLGGVSHFAAPGFGKVVRAGDGHDWELA